MKGYDSYDATLIKTVKPSGTTATTKTTDAIDLGSLSGVGVRSETFELEIQVPAYTATELPSNAKLTIGLQCSDDADFTTSETVESATYGNGTANGALNIRFKPTLDSARYWRVFVTTTLTNSATVDATALAKSIGLAYVC